MILMLQGEFSLGKVLAGAGPIALGTLLVLAAMSVAGWAIWGSRRWVLARAVRDARFAREAFLRAADTAAFAQQCRSLPDGPVQRLFFAAHDEYQELVRSWSRPGPGRPWEGVRAEAGRQLLTRTLAGGRAREVFEARVGLPVLATIGATAPFVGLFGTVWGVVRAFEGIGTSGSAELAVIAPGIAEALVATAAGLLAAVPAVWFYNSLTHQARRLSSELERFAVDFLNVYDRAVAASGSEGGPT